MFTKTSKYSFLFLILITLPNYLFGASAQTNFQFLPGQSGSDSRWGAGWFDLAVPADFKSGDKIQLSIGLYTVSAVNHSDVFGDFSNSGYAGDWTSCDQDYPDDPFPCATVDYAAPGVDVISLQPDGSLVSWWGTSMAAPHVTGIILLLQNNHIKPGTDGFAIDDPDGRPDPIIHR